MKYSEVTLTITTSKRFNLFKKSIMSFYDRCKDWDLIKNIIIVDDASSKTDIENMKQLLSGIKKDILFICKDNPDHVQSLNILFDKVKTDYVFHLEDDWNFIQHGNFIREGFEIMADNDKIKTVIMRNWIKQGNKDFHRCKTKTGLEYHIHHYNFKKHIPGELNTYPGYSLNPSLQNMKHIKDIIGKFTRTINFELQFALRYCNIGTGFLTAMMANDYCEHIGTNINAYALNNTKP